MSSDTTFWHNLGYALERARSSLPGTSEAPAKSRGKASKSLLSWPETDDLVTSGAVILVAKVLDAWRPSGKVHVGHLLRASLAGAAAALVVELLRPLVRGEGGLPAIDRGTADRMLAGAGQGLLYGAVVEPRVPGPALLKGALFGSAEYAADSAGGLTKMLRSHTPQGRVPILRDFLEGLEPDDRNFVEHLAFGVAVALLSGGPASRNGQLGDD